jgi:hypothetical protein
MEANSNRIMRTLFAGILIGVLAILLMRAGVAQAMSLSKCNPDDYKGNLLQGVATVSPIDIWAVGYYQSSSSLNDMTLIEHWDGTQWSIVPSPAPGLLSALYGVTAISTDDVWAVGYYIDSSQNDQTLIEHWDGTQWSIVPSANPEQDFLLSLYGVTAISANDIWAVGDFSASFHDNLQTLTLHWDGTQWSVVPSADDGTGNDVLQSVSAASANDVWAVGANASAGTLVEHWDGTQ